MMDTGLLATWLPFFLMLTRCSPTSRGMKEMPMPEHSLGFVRWESRTEGGSGRETHPQEGKQGLPPDSPASKSVVDITMQSHSDCYHVGPRRVTTSCSNVLPAPQDRAGECLPLPQLRPGRQPGLTDVVVGQPLQETGLVAARWGLNAGRQGAQVGLADVKQEVGGRAQLHLRAPSAVIWETAPPQVRLLLHVVSPALWSPHSTCHSQMIR